jgi:hypothetical protein
MGILDWLVVALIAAVVCPVFLIFVVFVARILRPSSKPAATDRLCPGCGSGTVTNEVFCSHCGLVLTSARAHELEELAAAARQVHRLQVRGELDADTALRVERALTARRREILRPPVKAAPPVTVPVTAEVRPIRPTPPVRPRTESEEILEVLPVVEPAAPPILKPANSTPEQFAPVPPSARVIPAPPAPPVRRPPARRAEPPQPPAPRRSLASVLAAFMEQRNILWGELIGGILIVGCSVALVISLWQSLEAIPYFPFLLFSSITLALFGAGEYTLHHWKLKSTSRGLLVIALMLAPLNLLVLGDPAAAGRTSVAAGGLVDFAIKVITLLGFSAVARFAGRDLLAPDITGRGRLTILGVIAVVAAPLLGSALLDVGRPEWFLLLGTGSVACQFAAVAVATATGRRLGRSVFTVTGLTSFSAAVALGFLVTRGGDLRSSLQLLGTMLPLAGCAVLLGGLRARQLRGEEGDSAESGWRTAATALVCTGLAAMLAAPPLAWPAAGALLAVSLVSGALLIGLAFHFRIPSLHTAALPFLALASLLAFHLAAGRLPARDLGRLLVAGESGAALAVFAAVVAVVSEVLVRMKRLADARAFAIGWLMPLALGLLSVTAEGVRRPELAALTYGIAAATILASNGRWRRLALEYAGLGLAVGGSLWALQWKVPGELPIWAFVLGAESAGLALTNLLGGAERRTRSARDAAVATGVLAVLLLAAHGVVPIWYAATCAALSASAVCLALARRSPGWFAICQTAASAAVVFAIDASLRGRWWYSPLDSRSLQTYGIGLSALSLAWASLRLALRNSEKASHIGLTGFTVDRVVLGLLVVGQFVLAVAGVVPDVVAEMMPDQHHVLPPGPEFYYGNSARLLLTILAVVLLVNLWERGRTTVVVGLGLLAFTVPVLVAGPFAGDLATASALRWGLAATYLFVSGLVWAREPLARYAAVAGIHFRRETLASVATRILASVAAAVVLVLTAWMAGLAFAGQSPAGPTAESIFARIGWTASATVPLVLLIVGLTGHALREHSQGYAFVAGLVAEATLAGGYLLAVVTSGRTPGETEFVRAAQLATLGAGIWAVAWIVARSRVYSRIGVILDIPASAGPLLLLQVALAVGGNMALLGGAVAIRGNVLVDPLAWSPEAGSLLGGAALLAGLAAFGFWHQQHSVTVSWQAPFFIGLSLPVWAACAVERSLPGAGYRLLLLAWPAYLVLWSLSTLWPSLRGRLLRHVTFDDSELPVGVLLASLFTAFVAVRAIWRLDGYSIAAAATVETLIAFAVLAFSLRSEALAFIAATLANVAVSLLIANANHDQGLQQWASLLARANIATSACAALAWLWVRRSVRTTAPGPILGLQAMLGLAASTVLLLLPLGTLLLEPDTSLPAWLQPESPISGLPALLLATSAAFWYCQQISPESRLNVLGIAWLAAGVALARLAAPYDTGNWMSFHVLGVAWAALGMTGVGIGSMAYALRNTSSSNDGPVSDRFLGLVYAAGVRRWVEISCVAVAILAFRGAWDDPYRPYTSSAAMLLVSVMLAALAMWFRRSRHVWASGLVFNLAGVVIWLAHPGTLDGFVLTNAIGLAAAATLWTAIALILPGGWPIDRGVRFSHFASAAALTLLTAVAGTGWGSRLAGDSFVASGVLTWSATLMIGIALVVALWDTSARWPVAGLYLWGLDILLLALPVNGIAGDALFRATTVGLAAYLTLAALCARAFTLGAVESLRMPPRDANWLAQAQRVLALAVGCATAGISISAPLPESRLLGPLALAIAVPAAALGGRRERSLTLALAAGVPAALALAVPNPAGAAPWLERTAWLLVALVLTEIAYGDGLPQILSRWQDWVDEARRAGDVLAGLALATQAALVARELWLYDAVAGRTPLAAVAAWPVAGAIVVLAGSSVRRALVPARDPFQLPAQARTAYVYFAEILVLFVVAHLRMTVPELFNGWFAQHWTLVVMLVGFLGMALGELCDRGGLSVLGEPLSRTGLALPLVPLTTFWVKMPLVPAAAFPQDLGQYAILWLLVAVLYGVAAGLWRSPVMALLSAFALNFGLWSLLANGGVAFLSHPQVWLIPPALIVLVAEYRHRDTLPAEVAAGLRYLGVCTVYVSSTADLFIAGLGNSVVLPVVLAMLAVAGVLAGISLRVRAFLFPGVCFLLLDVFTMIWYAAVDRYHTWVWWVSGIVLGAAILALFAVFEKRRDDVLRLIDDLKQWD